MGDLVRSQNPGPSPTATKEYHGWNIKYQTAPRVRGGMIEWMAWHGKKDPSTAHRGKSVSPDAAFQDATAWINDEASGDQEVSQNVTIDFNIKFAEQHAMHGEAFYANIDDGYLIFSLVPQKGLKKSHPRANKSKLTDTNMKMQSISLSQGEALKAKLKPNARYQLGEKESIDANTDMYKIHYQSTSQGSGDKLRMNEPGFTVAQNR
jgi:hypothetical protein